MIGRRGDYATRRNVKRMRRVDDVVEEGNNMLT